MESGEKGRRCRGVGFWGWGWVEEVLFWAAVVMSVEGGMGGKTVGLGEEKVGRGRGVVVRGDG